MGSVASSSQSPSSPSNCDPIIEARRFIIGQAMDMGRLGTLKWDDFLRYISALNIQCRQLVDTQGKYVLFAIKKGSQDSVFWKATLRICALKMNHGTGKVESRKILTLPQFLRLHTSLLSFLGIKEPSLTLSPDSENSTTPTTETPSPVLGASALFPENNMGASMILSELERRKGDDLSSDCVICMERKPDVLLPCSHSYCLPCIEQWKVNHGCCPICRCTLQSTDDAWVISEAPDEDEVSNYLLSLTASQ